MNEYKKRKALNIKYEELFAIFHDGDNAKFYVNKTKHNNIRLDCKLFDSKTNKIIASNNVSDLCDIKDNQFIRNEVIHLGLKTLTNICMFFMNSDKYESIFEEVIENDDTFMSFKYILTDEEKSDIVVDFVY